MLSSLEHVSASPFRFQKGMIIPFGQLSGICYVDQACLKMLASLLTTASPPFFDSSADRCPMNARSLFDLVSSELIQVLLYRWCKEGSHLDGWHRCQSTEEGALIFTDSGIFHGGCLFLPESSTVVLDGDISC